jgi:glutathione S-transferase
MAALDRLEEELDGREYLVGDAFSVADLTAAALLYGLVLPPEGPWHPENVPVPWEARMEALGDRPASLWVCEMYARHRFPA